MKKFVHYKRSLTTRDNGENINEDIDESDLDVTRSRRRGLVWPRPLI